MMNDSRKWEYSESSEGGGEWWLVLMCDVYGSDYNE